MLVTGKSASKIAQRTVWRVPRSPGAYLGGMPHARVCVHVHCHTPPARAVASVFFTSPFTTPPFLSTVSVRFLFQAAATMATVDATPASGVPSARSRRRPRDVPAPLAACGVASRLVLQSTKRREHRFAHAALVVTSSSAGGRKGERVV